MELSYRFRQIQWSEELVDYLADQTGKLSKFELKPTHLTATFIAERHDCRVELHLRGPEFETRSSATGASFFEAVDVAVEKIKKQMSRRKGKVQNHRCVERSSYGKISQLNPELEVAYKPSRKAS